MTLVVPGFNDSEAELREVFEAFGYDAPEEATYLEAAE